jgi:hypothetical protein
VFVEKFNISFPVGRVEYPIDFEEYLNCLDNRDIGGLDGLYEALLTSYVDDAAKYVSGSSRFRTMRHAMDSRTQTIGRGKWAKRYEVDELPRRGS